MTHTPEDRARLNIRAAMAERKHTQKSLAAKIAKRDDRFPSSQAVHQLLNPRDRYRFNRELAELIRQEYGYPKPWPFPSGMTLASAAMPNDAVISLPSVLPGTSRVELPMPVLSTSLRAFVVQTPDLYPAIAPGDILLVAPAPKPVLACLNLLQAENGSHVVRVVEYDGDHWIAVNPMRPDAPPVIADSWNSLGVVIAHVGQRKGEKFWRLNSTGIDRPQAQEPSPPRTSA